MGRGWVIAGAFFLAGCSHPSTVNAHDPILGTWVTTERQSRLMIAETLTFRPNGDYSVQAKVRGVGSSATIVEENQGTWKVGGPNHYITHCDDVRWTLEGATPAAAARVIKKFRLRKAKALADINKHPDLRVIWNGRSSFTGTRGDTTDIYLRSE